MRLTGKVNTVFSKLLISYIVLSLFAALTASVVIYYSAATNYNKEITRLNENILNYVHDVIDEHVVSRVERLAINVLLEHTENPRFSAIMESDSPWDIHEVKQVYDYLCTQRGDFSELAEAVHVYYPLQNKTISSISGINQMDSVQKEALFGTACAEALGRSGKSTAWLNTRQVSLGMDVNSMLFTLVKAYPYATAPEACKLFVAVDIRADALCTMLKDATPDTGAEIFVLDANANVIAHNLTQRIGENVADLGYVQRLMENRNGSGSFSWRANHVNEIVSYTPFRANDWLLVTVTASDSYYKVGNDVRRMAVLILLMVVALSSVISGCFAGKFYHPLKAVLENIRAMIAGPERQGDEYRLINDTINTLHSKVEDLRQTLDQHAPQMQQNLINALLYHSVQTPAELVERLQLLQLPMPDGPFCCILLSIDEERYQLLDLESRQYLKFAIIEYLEQNAPSSQFFLAAELIGSINEIGIVTESRDIRALEDMLHTFQEYLFSNFYLNAASIIGTQAEDLMQVYQSFSSAEAAKKYWYFMPERSVLIAEDLQKWEQSRAVFEPHYEAQFAGALQSRDMAKVKDALERLLSEMASGVYSAQECNRQLLSLVSAFSAFLHENYLKTADVMDGALEEEFAATKNVTGFKQWMLSVVYNTFQRSSGSTQDRNREMIDKIKRFCAENLCGDLSLISISEHVFISPKYLSRLFKTETGQNLTEYIYQLRMERAKELLLTTDESIEEISRQVGFNTPHYFIKKFKETFGVTPKRYARDNRE